MAEEWKDIPGFEGWYQVSNMGRVKSLQREVINSLGKKYIRAEKIIAHLFNPSTNSYFIVLSKNAKHYSKRVAQLVASAFINNVNNYKFIKHKNNNKKDNRASNLEWVKVNHNVNLVYQYSLDGELIKTWRSVKTAAKFYGYSITSIYRCCAKITNTYNNYIWTYSPLTSRQLEYRLSNNETNRK